MHHRHLPAVCLLILPLLFLSACSLFRDTVKEQEAEPPQAVHTSKVENNIEKAEKAEKVEKVEAVAEPKPEPEPGPIVEPEPKPALVENKEEITTKTPLAPIAKDLTKKHSPPPTATISTAPTAVTGSLRAKVQIMGKKNKTHRPSNVVVTLSPEFAVPPQTNTPVIHDIDMKKKTYTPTVQTIHRGDSLQFHNRDNIKHNVFSSSGDNTFDLGTFEGGGVRSVQMKHSGIVKVYCNIHPEMATFVMVTDNSFDAITDNNGEFAIENIPPGKYVLKLWHIRGELEQEIFIAEGENLLEALTINAANYKRVAHKNKFGEDYQKKPALFEDEFY